MGPTAALEKRPAPAPVARTARIGPTAAAAPKAIAKPTFLSHKIGHVVPKKRAPSHAAAPPVAVTAGKSGADTVKAQIKAAGAHQKTHQSAEHAASESQHAADVTPDQAQGEGRAQQLGTMALQQKGSFDRATFKAKLREKIGQLKADDAKNIKDGDKGAQLNAEVKGTVAEGQRTATGAIDGAAKQPPPPGDPKKGEALPKPAPAEPPKVDGGLAVPPPVPDARVSMAGEAGAIDRQMAAAKVTPKQLDKANEPTFKAAATARSNATTSAAALPGNTRAKERALHANTKAGQAAATNAGLAGMHGKRGTQLAAAMAKQVDGKAQQEAARKRISAELTQIYTNTKTSVDDRLKKLDDDVAMTFDEGASSAKWDFYEFLGLKLLVYYAAGGWAADLITGGNSKEKIFDEGRAAYMKAMDRVIDHVADVVEKGLNDVVAIIAGGKKNLDAAVAKMSPSDQEVAREVATGIQGQFAELEKSVEDKQNEIIDSVAKKYVAAQKDVDATVNALRNPVGALIDMAVDAVSGVIETILKMRELLLSALAKAREAIDIIVDDPIGFLRNLVAGVKQGVNNFVTNIATHLKKGLLEWLFGALAGAGIQMPDKFDLSGLLSIALQVLGLTWTNIRARAVKIVGEPVVKALETASEIVKILATKGVSGLWEYVKEQAAAMLETLKESVKTMVIENVIKAGVKWLIGLLNPASAFVKACMAIVDIVSFIIDRGQQILEFVNAVLDSVLAIAKGQIGVAAKAVEWALAKAVPVAIGFLASLLGLGDLSKDIKKVIDKIQAPVNKMIDWVINKAVALVKAVGKLLGFGKKDEDKVDTRTADEKLRDVKKAVDLGSKFAGDRGSPKRKVADELNKLKKEYRLSSLQVVVDTAGKATNRVHVHGEVNPTYNSQGFITDSFPPDEVIIEAEIGPPAPRAHYERKVLEAPSAAGLSGYERAHLLGAGFGVESPLGLYYAPRFVNQILQNRGIEETIRNSYATRYPGAKLFIQARAKAHPGTNLLARVVYKLSGSLPGEPVTDIFEFTISVSPNVSAPSHKVRIGEVDLDALPRYSAELARLMQLLTP